MWKLETYSRLQYGYKNNVINGAVQNLKQFVIKNIKQSYIRDYEWNYLILHMLQILKITEWGRFLEMKNIFWKFSIWRTQECVLFIEQGLEERKYIPLDSFSTWKTEHLNHTNPHTAFSIKLNVTGQHK